MEKGSAPEEDNVTDAPTTELICKLWGQVRRCTLEEDISHHIYFIFGLCDHPANAYEAPMQTLGRLFTNATSAQLGLIAAYLINYLKK
jgi:hypothetical protein